MNRIKHITGILLTILFLGMIIFVQPATALAQSDPAGSNWNRPLISDAAGLLEEDELQDLCEISSEISQQHNLSIAVVTTPDFQDNSVFGMDFTGDDILEWEKLYYTDQNLGMGKNSDSCILLAVSMADRDWGIQTFGSAVSTMDTYAREEIGSYILDDLSEGEYYDAFETFFTMTDEFLTAAENGEAYTYDNPYKEHVPIPLIITVAFVISLIVSLIIVRTWKKSMDTRIRQDGAGAYLKEGSFQLTGHSDIFLYHHVTRTKKESSKNNRGGSMHSSSSGTRGKF